MLNRFKLLSLALVMVLVPLARMVPAQPKADEAEKTAKVRSEVAKRVSNKKTRVKVKLRTGEEVKGRIDQADDNTFTITQDKTGKKIEMAYSDVERVRGRGGLSTFAKIGIVAGVALVVFAIVVVVAFKNFDPFEGGIAIRSF